MITSLYLESKATVPRLRVAALVDGPVVPRYVALILEDIARCNFADVELAVIVQRPVPKLAERLLRLAHDLYVRADLAVGGEGDPLALVDPGPGLAGVDRIEVSPGEAGEPWLSADDLAEIRRRDLDVILRFCAATPSGEVLRAARYGVWSYQFGTEDDARSGTPFLQQVVDDAPTRDVLLEVLADEPAAGLVLCRSRFGRHGNLFLAHNRDVAFWETTHFVVWKLHDLHELGWEHLRARSVPRASQAEPRPPSVPHLAAGLTPVPTATTMVRFLAPRVRNAVRNRVRGEGAVANQWRIALRRTATPLGATPEATSLSGFRWIETPPEHFWADPFLCAHRGQTVLFFEDFDYAAGYASICWAEVHEDCTVGPVATCLDRGYHVSFPFVFEHEGEVFMIPESISDGTVTLYRARTFPSEWVPEKVLFRGNASDTSVFHEGGLFYFFTSLHERDDRGMNAMLFVADSLTGAWRLHPASPVSSDVRDARNAGAVFRREGRLFRPTQNCGPSYGYGLNLKEIVSLDEARYEERRWCALDPSALPFPAIGIHTYNACGDLETIDGCAKLEVAAGSRMPSRSPSSSLSPLRGRR